MRLLLLALFCSLFFSCGAETPAPQLFTIVSYNVQNLMDANLDGTEYTEYTPDGGWTDAAYKARLSRLSQVLRTSEIHDADVLVLQEVEHRGVMEDLMRLHLSRSGWTYFAVVKDPSSPIGIGIASKVEPEFVRSHHGHTGRPILEASFSVGGQRIILYGVHGKSQIGTDTEEARIDMARTVASAASEWNDALVVVCGDFNEDPDVSRTAGEQTALVLLDLPSTALYTQNGSLPVTGNRSRVSGPVWYSPYLDSSLDLGKGSYVYQSVWHRFDQMLGQGALFDGKGWDFLDFSILSQPLVCNADGTPFAWDRTLLSGYSDHFPIRIRLIGT